MEIKEYWPRYLQDVIEFDQIARAEQPEFTKVRQDVQGAPDDFLSSACPTMAVGAGRSFWAFLWPLTRPWKRAAKKS